MRWLRRSKKPARLERVLADFDEELEASRKPVLAYTRTGRVAHILGPDHAALCPRLKPAGTSVWMTDPERLAALPPCHACRKVAGLEDLS